MSTGGKVLSRHHFTTPGALDRAPEEAELLHGAEELLLGLWRRRGYRLAQVPTYEAYALYERLYGDEVRQRLVTFTTDREYAMRPDLTAGLCRMVSEQIDASAGLVTPLRLAASGRAFRHERVRPLRQRMFHQMGLERLGDPESARSGAEVELLSLARAALMALGIGGGVIRVGCARLRSDALAVLGAGGARISPLLDALARLRDRLHPPRTGADLSLDAAARHRTRVSPLEHPDIGALLSELRQMVRREAPNLIGEDAGAMLEALEGLVRREVQALGLAEAQVEALLGMSWSAASLGELADTLAPLLPGSHEALKEALGHVESCRDELDPFVLRFSLGATRWGGFYTGFLFEIDAPVLGPDVSQVLGGGRYDGVMEALQPGLSHIPACGFALGLERCLKAAILLHGESHLRRRVVEREPLLVCFSSDEADAERALGLAERLERRGVSMAFHPAPLEGAEALEAPQSFVEGLGLLPGLPYRQALWVVSGGLRLIDVPAQTTMEISEQDLFTIFDR